MRVTADRAIPAAATLLGALCLVLWLYGGDVKGLEQRAPAPAPRAPVEMAWKPIKETAALVAGEGAPSDLPGAWPRFRGPNADGLAVGTPELARSWPAQGPEVLWSIPVGEGHAGAAVLDGRVYLLDYDQAARRDTLRCLSLETGKDIWRFSYPVEVMRQYGMSRTVPAVTQKYAVSLGPKCHVTCVDSRTGELRWAYDLAHEFGAEVPRWYAGQCPLIDRGRAVIAVGGKDVLLMAVDCETGQIAWKTPNPKGWKTTHSSVMPMEFAGRRMYIYCATGGVAGVSAEDGSVLWQTDAWRVPFANVPSPVIVGDGRILLAGGYGAGSMMIRLRTGDGGNFTPEILFKLDQRVFSAEQHTPILYNGFVYGVTVDGWMVCLDLAGTPVWTSNRKFGRGNYIIADGLIFAMNDADGTLTLVEAAPSGYRELARSAVLPGPEAYGPMAVAGGRLLVRNLGTLACLRITRR